MRSMTGFGAGAVPLRSGRLTVELRSLNHRFLELRVRVPAEVAEHTFFLEQLCRDRMNRGRYDVSVRLDDSALPSTGIDMNRARATYQSLCLLRDEFAPGTEVPLTALTAIPDLLNAPLDTDIAPVRAALQRGLELALEQLDEMRTREGNALRRDMTERLGECRKLCSELAQELPRLIAAYEKRLQQRLTRLLKGQDTIDERRLAMEVAILAERSDIAEELARLGSHFDQFQAFVDSSKPVGRKLDFLLQEMAREANTVGAKCPDADLSKLVIALKAEVERLREQVQNVE